jgi:hypothetical protein
MNVGRWREEERNLIMTLQTLRRTLKNNALDIQ